MGAALVVIGGGFLLSSRIEDKVTALLLVFAGVYAILWQEPVLLGFGQQFHVALAQPVFLLLLSGAIFIWTYWLFEKHVERLEDARDELANAFAIERTLVDVLSHDLRNPLAAADLELQSLERDHPEIAAELTDLRDSLCKARDVMDDGLLYSRLSLDRVEGPTEQLDVASMVADAVDHTTPTARAKDVTVDLETDTVEIEGSPLLERAFANILDNAIKYSPEGQTVTVQVEDLGEAAGVTVIDHGPGMPEGDPDRWFDRFEQGEDGSGSGLGLSIVERLVDLHSGEVEAYGTDGGGTTVEVLLPKANARIASSNGTQPGPARELPAAEEVGA